VGEREYLLYIETHGRLIERLQSEPSISDTKSPTDYGHGSVLRYSDGGRLLSYAAQL